MIAAALCLFAGILGIVAVGAVILVVFAALDGLDDLPDFDDETPVRPLADCNAGKTSTTVDATFVEQVSEDSAKWDQAKAAVEEGRRAAALEIEQELYAFRYEWEEYCGGDMDCDWKQSVKVWRSRGLPLEDILGMIPTVMGRHNVADRDRWRYFCGCMWRKITELEEAVAEEYQRRQAAEVAAPRADVSPEFREAASSFFRELEPGVREWIEDDSPEPTKLGHMFPNMFGSANGAD